MNKGKLLAYFLFGLTIFHIPALAQTSPKSCKDIDVKVDVAKEEQPTDVLRISFKDNGNYKIQVLDSKGKIAVYKSLTIRDLETGEYDLIITDQEDSNRCPFYKRIKIGRH